MRKILILLVLNGSKAQRLILTKFFGALRFTTRKRSIVTLSSATSHLERLLLIVAIVTCLFI